MSSSFGFQLLVHGMNHACSNVVESLVHSCAAAAVVKKQVKSPRFSLEKSLPFWEIPGYSCHHLHLQFVYPSFDSIYYFTTLLCGHWYAKDQYSCAMYFKWLTDGTSCMTSESTFNGGRFCSIAGANIAVRPLWALSEDFCVEWL